MLYQEFITVRVCHRVSTTTISAVRMTLAISGEYVLNWPFQAHMYIGNHNLHLYTKVHLLLQCLHSLCTCDFTTDCQLHTARWWQWKPYGSCTPLIVINSWLYLSTCVGWVSILNCFMLSSLPCFPAFAVLLSLDLIIFLVISQRHSCFEYYFRIDPLQHKH